MARRKPTRRCRANPLARIDRVAVEAGRPVDRMPEVSAGGLPYRLLWCRIGTGSPGDPPDERYYADEVRPTGVGPDGRLQWEAVPGGPCGIVVHNVAEAASATHLLDEDTVVRVEERLDRGAPPEFLYLAAAGVPAAQDRLARIVSYDEGGTYTVQPARRESGGFVDDGDEISGVPNIGELWDDERGYLAGPGDFDRYVRIIQTPAGWTILLHPPRMV
jgi:hypothetical protein